MNGRSSNVWPLACWCMPNIHQFMLSAHLVLIEPKRNQMVDELAKENRFFAGMVKTIFFETARIS